MPKKLISLLVAICLNFLLSACAANLDTTDNVSQIQSIADTLSENQDNISENNIIKTDYFSMFAPKTWEKKYRYHLREANEPDDIDLYISMVSQNEISEAHLFTVYILSLNNTENIKISLEGWIEPVGIISKNDTNLYLIGYSLASEMACIPEEEEVFLQMIDDVPQIIKSINAAKGYVFREWDDSMIGEILPGDYTTPYASLSFDILNASFEGYKNQTGATFFENSTQGFLEPYYIKKLEAVKYFYGTNEVVVGVKDNDIYLMMRWASDIAGHTSPQVREVINELGANELFEIYPAVLEVENTYNSNTFFYWKIENGYIGFVTIGGNDPTNCYSSCALSVLLFKDLSIINSSTN